MSFLSNASDWARKGILAYLFLVPWIIVFVSGYSAHDFSRIAEVVLGAFCGLALLAARPLLPVSRRQQWVGIALFAATAASVAWAPRPDWAWREVALFTDLILMAAVIGMGGLDRARQLLRVAALAFSFYGVLELLIINAGLFQGQPVPRLDFVIGYDNPRFFNHVATVALLLCLTTAVTDEVRGWRLVAWTGLVVGGALTLYSGGRAVVFADLLAVFVVFAWLRSAAMPWVSGWIKGALLGLGLYVVQFLALPWSLGLPTGSHWTERIGDQGSVTSRLILWRDALSGWWQSPWLGIGPMHFAHYPNGDAAHPHNIYVQLLSEWGLIVFAIFCWGLSSGVLATARALTRPLSESMRLLGAGLWAALLAAMVDGCFSGNVVMPVSQVWIAVSIGALWAWWHSLENSEIKSNQSSPSSVSIPALLLAAGLSSLLAISAIHDFLRLGQVLDEAHGHSISYRSNPRFWSEGWF